MKRTVPMLITGISGFVLLISFFIPYTEGWGEKAAIWFDILAAIAFILGGIAGSVGGPRASARLDTRKGALNSVFAGLIVIVALYMLARSWPALFN